MKTGMKEPMAMPVGLEKAEIAAPVKTPLARMKMNVATIREPAEKERWTANMELWDFAMPDGAPPPVTKAKVALETMKANLGRIVDLPEKERWDANAKLWELKFMAPTTPTKADVTKMTGLLDRLELNIEKITYPTERERWLANRDLWEATIRPT